MNVPPEHAVRVLPCNVDHLVIEDVGQTLRLLALEALAHSRREVDVAEKRDDRISVEEPEPERLVAHLHAATMVQKQRRFGKVPAMRNLMPAISLSLALTLTLAPMTRADELDMGKIADLEALVQRVEREGFKRFTFEKVKPGVPDPTLVFAVQGNTIDKEKEFRKAWIAAYDAIGKELQEQVKPLAKDKKDPGARDALKLLGAATSRIQEVKTFVAKPAEKETFDARDREIKKFLKRYDFGPKIAKATADGTAIVNVNLPPDTYELVKRNVYAWKFQPLKDAQGADVKVGGKRIEFTDALSQSDVREALKMLTNEYFVVRYAKWEKEKETELIRITGAKLLLGTYYFIEHEDRLVVAREPGAKSP